MDGPVKKPEFSKIMAVVAVAMWLFVNLFGLVIIVITLDTSPLVYIIGSVDAVVAVVLHCYYSKAKLENTIKLKKIYGEDAAFVIRNTKGGIADEGSGTESFGGLLKF